MRNPLRQHTVKTSFIEGLADVVVHAGIDAFLLFMHHGMRRHGNDRQFTAIVQQANRTGRGETIHDRHLNVHENQIEAFRRGRNQVECRLSVRCQMRGNADS